MAGQAMLLNDHHDENRQEGQKTRESPATGLDHAHLFAREVSPVPRQKLLNSIIQACNPTVELIGQHQQKPVHGVLFSAESYV